LIVRTPSPKWRPSLQPLRPKPSAIVPNPVQISSNATPSNSNAARQARKVGPVLSVSPLVSLAVAPVCPPCHGFIRRAVSWFPSSKMATTVAAPQQTPAGLKRYIGNSSLRDMTRRGVSGAAQHPLSSAESLGMVAHSGALSFFSTDKCGLWAATPSILFRCIARQSALPARSRPQGASLFGPSAAPMPCLLRRAARRRGRRE
jgi:hypothetical protein